MPRFQRWICLWSFLACYNEELGIAEFVRRMTDAAHLTFGNSFELILVNDGSRDGTWAKSQSLVAAYESVRGSILPAIPGASLPLRRASAWRVETEFSLLMRTCRIPPNSCLKWRCG